MVPQRTRTVPTPSSSCTGQERNDGFAGTHMRPTMDDEHAIQPSLYIRELKGHYLRRYEDDSPSMTYKEATTRHIALKLQSKPTWMAREHKERIGQNCYRNISLHISIAPTTEVDYEPNAQKRQAVAINIVISLYISKICRQRKKGLYLIHHQLLNDTDTAPEVRKLGSKFRSIFFKS